MANEKQLEILKSGVDNWNQWKEEYKFIIDLSGADLADAKLIDANFSEVNLSGANLSRANLSRANLTRADLVDTDLADVNFTRADLSRADLSRVRLSRANLTGADLTEACLFNADLTEANLFDAKLTRADLTHANLSLTRIINIDLRNIIRLETIEQGFMPYLDFSTLRKSQGKLPVEFLRGVGLSDWEIESAKLYNPDLTPDEISEINYKVDELRNTQPIQLFPVFLSHSHKDKKFVRSLYDGLQNKGVRCWLDDKQLKPGNRIIRGITQGINLYDKTVLICSEHSLKSIWVERELERILEKEEKYNHGKPEKERVELLVPITLDDYVFEKWESPWKTEVRRHVIGDFQNCEPGSKKFKQSLKQLIDGLRVNPKNPRPPTFLPKL